MLFGGIISKGAINAINTINGFNVINGINIIIDISANNAIKPSPPSLQPCHQCYLFEFPLCVDLGFFIVIKAF